MKTPMLN